MFGDYFLLGISGVGMFTVVAGLYDTFKNFHDLNSTAVKLRLEEPIDIKDILEKMNKVSVKSLKEEKDIFGRTHHKVIVKGALKSTSKLTSQFKPNVKLITRVNMCNKELETYPITIHGETFKKYDKIIRTETNSSVYLYDPKNLDPSKQVLIADFNSERFGPVNSLIYRRDTLRPVDWFDNIVHG